MSGLPFTGTSTVTVVVPTQFKDISASEARILRDLPALIRENQTALETELGAPLVISEHDPGEGARWLIGPAHCNPAIAGLIHPAPDAAYLYLDRGRQLLITNGADAAAVIETFSYLRSLYRLADGVFEVGDCGNLDEAIEVIVREVALSYPSFELRALDWERICAEHVPRVRAAAEPVAAIQEWLAVLEDAHTWLRPVPAWGELPYGLRIDGDRALFTSLPPDSTAWEAGVRPGYLLLDEDLRGCWRRTAATAHSRPYVAGKRLLAAPVDTLRRFSAVSPSGRRVSWEERVPPRERQWLPPLTWRRLPSGAGYLKLKAFLAGQGIEESLDDAISAFAGAPGLVVDLRGNPGGNFPLALRVRDRFLRRPGLMGSLRTSLPGGGLSAPAPIYAHPAPERQRWMGPVRFLTDALSYSAAEDALLGLQGLDHVEVLGTPSGGGSGRVRTIRLLPGWRLTVSTALTYDRNGRCIEGNGIPVDRLVPESKPGRPDEDPLLWEADRNW